MLRWGGMLRKKDWPKALKLARIIRDQEVICRFSETEMKPFHDFLERRAKRYPGYLRYRFIANWVRDRVPKRVNYTGTYYGRQIQPLFFGTKEKPL